VSAAPPAWAETVWDPAAVLLNVPVATPFAPVTAAGWLMLAVPVTARMTLTPEIGLLRASFTVTVTVSSRFPEDAVSDAGDTATVDTDALMAPPVVMVKLALVSTGSAPLLTVSL